MKFLVSITHKSLVYTNAYLFFTKKKERVIEHTNSTPISPYSIIKQ